MKMRFIACLFLMVILLSGVTAKLWELNPKGDNQKLPESMTGTVEVIPPEVPSCPENTGYERTVLKQFIGKLLNQYKQHMIPDEDAEKVEFNMKMMLSSSDFRKISLYLTENKNIHEVKDALMSMLVEVPSELPVTFYEKCGYVLSIAPVLVLLLALKFMHLPFWVLMKLIFFLIFVISVIWNWYFLYQAISFCIVNILLKLAYVGENIGLFFQKLLQYILFPLLAIAAIFNLIVLLLVIIEYYGYSIGGLLIPLIPQTIKNKLDKVMEILDKIPNIDHKVEEMHEILQKKIALENKPELPSMENGPASGHFGGIQETQFSLKSALVDTRSLSQSLGDLHQSTW